MLSSFFFAFFYAQTHRFYILAPLRERILDRASRASSPSWFIFFVVFFSTAFHRRASPRANRRSPLAGERFRADFKKFLGEGGSGSVCEGTWGASGPGVRFQIGPPTKVAEADPSEAAGWRSSVFLEILFGGSYFFPGSVGTIPSPK